MVDSVKNLAGKDIDISSVNDLWHVIDFLQSVEGDYKVLSKVSGRFIPYSEGVKETWQQALAMEHHINPGLTLIVTK